MVTLKRDDIQFYQAPNWTGNFLDHLAWFLTEDCDLSFAYPETIDDCDWLNDLKNPKEQIITTNSNRIMIKNGRVYIDFLFRRKKNDWSKATVTTVDNMIEVLHQWYEILCMESLPEEIIIMGELGNIRLVPLFKAEAREYMTAISARK